MNASHSHNQSSLLQGLASLAGRIMIATIFLLSAVGNKIPNFEGVVGYMTKHEVPSPRLLLIGAIALLIVGSLSVILGLFTRVGAGLLLVFLLAATYHFPNFWALEGAAQQAETIQFMKNLSLMGAMVFLMANGPGALSLDGWLNRRKQATSPSL